MSKINHLEEFQKDNHPHAYQNPIELDEEVGGSINNPKPDNLDPMSNSTYQSIPIIMHNNSIPLESQKSKIGHFIAEFKVHPLVFEIFTSLLVSVLVWLTIYTIVGEDESLPGGIVFVIVFLEFGGRTVGNLYILHL